MKLLITERFSMAEAWSAVPEWIRKAEADWFGEDGRMRAALLPLELDAAAIDLLCDTPAAGSALTGKPLPRSAILVRSIAEGGSSMLSHSARLTKPPGRPGH